MIFLVSSAPYRTYTLIYDEVNSIGVSFDI